MRRQIALLIPYVLMVSLLVLAGCGKNKEQTGKITGKVRVAGRNLLMGSVLVYSLDHTKSSYGMIENGTYTIDHAPVGSVVLYLNLPVPSKVNGLPGNQVYEMKLDEMTRKEAEELLTGQRVDLQLLAAGIKAGLSPREATLQAIDQNNLIAVVRADYLQLEDAALKSSVQEGRETVFDIDALTK